MNAWRRLRNTLRRKLEEEIKWKVFEEYLARAVSICKEKGRI